MDDDVSLTRIKIALAHRAVNYTISGTTPLNCGKFVADKVKRVDGISASADAARKNAPQRKVGARRRVRGASAGERRDSGSRDATPGANEARRRYSADEAS